MREHKIVPFGRRHVECGVCGTQWTLQKFESNGDPGDCDGPKGSHASGCVCPDHADLSEDAA